MAIENSFGAAWQEAEQAGAESGSEGKRKRKQKIDPEREEKKLEKQIRHLKRKDGRSKKAGKPTMDPELKEVTEIFEHAEFGADKLDPNQEGFQTESVSNVINSENPTEATPTPESAPKELVPGQKIKIMFDGREVEWVYEGIDPKKGGAIIHGKNPADGVFTRYDDAMFGDIEKWNPGFVFPKAEEVEEEPAEPRPTRNKKHDPSSRLKRGNAATNSVPADPEPEVTYDTGKPLKTRVELAMGQAEEMSRREKNKKTTEPIGQESKEKQEPVAEGGAQIDRINSIDEMKQKILPQLEQNVRNEIFSLKNMKGRQANQLFHEMLDNPLLNNFVSGEYDLVRDSISSQVPKLDVDSVMVPYRVVLDNLDSKIKSDPNFNFAAGVEFNKILRDYSENISLQENEKGEPATEEPIEKLEQTPEPAPEPTEDELVKFEEAMTTDGFEEFLAKDPKNLDDRSVAETLKLFEVFRHRELVTNTISTIANERFAEVTGFEYTESKDSVSEYINREAFEDPDKMLQYAEKIVTLVEQQNKIKELEAKADKYKETLPDHKLITKPERDRAFDEVAELSKYFGPAKMKFKEQQEISMKWISSDNFLKSKVGLLKSYLFDYPYAALHFSATFAGFHSKKREDAREEMKKTVGADKFTSKTENEYKAKMTEMLKVSDTVREIEFKRNAIHEGYTSTKEVLAGAFLEAKEAIETAKKKIKDEVDKLLGKVSGISDIKGVQDLLNKNTDAKLYGDKTILTEADVKSIQDRIDLKAREAIDNHVEKALSGTEGKKDNTILGTLKKSMEEYMNSGVASMKTEQVRAQVREALNNVIMKTKKGGKQENKIIHNRAVAFAKINRF